MFYRTLFPMSSFFPERTRLDRLLSHVTGLSRSDIKRCVKRGEVALAGQVVTDPSLQVQAKDELSFDGMPVEWPRPHYVMLHKPAGYVCSSDEPGEFLVHELVDRPWAGRLHAAGRLDKDTTGLVLLTDDGQWSHRLTSPRSGCEKRYLASLESVMDEGAVRAFADGLLLQGENRPTRPARLEARAGQQALVWLDEGRYHQVRRMFAACGNHVTALHREAIGMLELDADLAPGEWRELSTAEVESLL